MLTTLMKKRTSKLQASCFLDLVSQKIGVKCPRLVDHTNKNPRLQAPRFLCFSRWNTKLNTLHTCSKLFFKPRAWHLVLSSLFKEKGTTDLLAHLLQFFFKKNLKLQAIGFLRLSRWKVRPNTLHICNNIKKTLGRLTPGLLHFSGQMAWPNTPTPSFDGEENFEAPNLGVSWSHESQPKVECPRSLDHTNKKLEAPSP